MAKKYEGKLNAEGLSFAVIVSRFNDLITTRLLEGALDCLKRHGAGEEKISIYYVPGAFEIPMVAKQAAISGKYNSVIALSCLIRGETPHFDYVASEVAKGIAKASLDTGVPVAFGVLTAENLEQAVNRAGAKSGNKGFQAALTAIEMANLYKQLQGETC